MTHPNHPEELCRKDGYRRDAIRLAEYNRRLIDKSAKDPTVQPANSGHNHRESQ